MDALAILCSGREDLWPHFLQPVTFAHNTNPGNGRLFSPYFITHGGRNPPTLPDLLLKSRTNSSCEPPDLEIDSMAVDMVESMKTAHVCVRLALQDTRLKAKNKYDKNRSVPDFVEGDFVGLRAPPRRSKLSLKWRGPYIVSDPCNNTVFLKSVPHGPPTTGTRVNVDRLIHLNLSGDLDSTTVERSVIDNQHGLVNFPAISEAGNIIDDPPIPVPTVPVQLKKSLIPSTGESNVSNIVDAQEGEVVEISRGVPDPQRTFALVDRSFKEDFVGIGTTRKDREMITALFDACPAQVGLSPRRAVELIMNYPGYRRGYLKNVAHHTISLTVDRYGWLQRVHTRLYFIEDALGVGYVVGELLRSSVTGEKKHLVRFYQVVRPGSDVICEEMSPPDWILDSEIIFPLSITEERLPHGHLRL
ncbi:hypothetical protein Pmar_PMAR021000 [Perkinsus marinus ATCC 50983]|uniref:Uncharacterized protein n=1 Tax=Perkinsus marinus (strain ATCC 50983 / TXsc) TaxID=423536 RepID=C5KG48_PERM5|nr:hypothetical protein Pmar_PMAR021000 [Perkinsus marinus ATCC 50983]EER16404.1 hypothetical protein Pmar_PMAR021000 [Perkinsus marinus ATCC 50983]|eukprot:XP_002784608.1 hypothetical protein Pmar_PMAR021000 [Perkinsus marinus ATCC 50983]